MQLAVARQHEDLDREPSHGDRVEDWTDDQIERSRIRFSQACALSSAELALDDEVTPVRAADAIYEAWRSGRPENPAPYQALFEGILGLERAAAAVEIAPASRPPETAPPTTPDGPIGPMWTVIARASGRGVG